MELFNYLNNEGFVLSHKLSISDDEMQFVAISNEQTVRMAKQVFVWVFEDEELENSRSYILGIFTEADINLDNQLIDNRLMENVILSLAHDITNVESGTIRIYVKSLTYINDSASYLEKLYWRLQPRWTRTLLSYKALSTIQNTEDGKDLTQILSILDPSGEFENYYSSLDDSHRTLMNQVIQYALKLAYKDSLDAKKIGRYTSQPFGCSGCPIITFAQFTKNGTADSKTWKLRIPLNSNLYKGFGVVLPEWSLNPQCDLSLIQRGNDPNFRPLSIEDFLAHPDIYLIDGAIFPEASRALASKKPIAQRVDNNKASYLTHNGTQEVFSIPPSASCTQWFRFNDIIDIDFEGTFTPDWDSTYEGSYLTNNGCGLKVSRLHLKQGFSYPNLLTVRSMAYVIFSRQFKLLYVGISESNLNNGLLGGGGRLVHHVRKLIAASYSGTSHPKRWRKAAIQRYEVQKTQTFETDQDRLDDVYIAFVSSDNLDWRATDHEGTILDDIYTKLSATIDGITILNSGSVKRSPLDFTPPDNVFEN